MTEGSRWDRMSPQARENARARNRRWREQHRDEILEKDRVRHAANREQANAASRAWHEANRERANARVRDRVRVLGWRTYVHGISGDEHLALYQAQDGRCAICDEPKPIRGEDCLHIDHDHTTGERRGLICSQCNRALPLTEKYGGTWALRALAYLGDPPLRRLRKDKAS